MTSEFAFAVDPSKPRNSFLLNGFWTVAPGNDAGPTAGPLHSIPVPSLVDCADPKLSGREAEYYWYSCSFHMNELNASAGLWLKVDQAQFGTSVWVDETLAGGSTACYTSQEYRIDRLLKPGTRHNVTVRVGTKETLPPESAVGRDQERTSYTPGILGDVWLTSSGIPRIRRVVVLPSFASRQALVKVELEAMPNESQAISVKVAIREAVSKRSVVTPEESQVFHDGARRRVEHNVRLEDCRPWSTEDPFLYEALVQATRDEKCTDEYTVRFGMRDFAIVGNEFHLNGKRIFLKGGNIAFHRFLEDEERNLLPWNMEWVKKMLIDIPKAHHFNFFRMHLGHAYSRWYDLADEHGILLQEEWPFWNATGSNATIIKEMGDWIEENGNHPCIVIWDPLNESTDSSLLHDVVSSLRSADPTRPWEAVDFHEQHPYIYSLGMTLNERPLGYAISIGELARSSVPVVVNEFLWWWLDSSRKPTALMKDVVERWLGRQYKEFQVTERQSYLAAELVGLFRRMRCAAVQPFVYLSDNRGATAHWFEGPIADLKPKPILEALKNAYSPVGVSIDLWDRHYRVANEMRIPVHVFNDKGAMVQAQLEITVRSSKGGNVSQCRKSVEVPPAGRVVLESYCTVPTVAGAFTVEASVRTGSGAQTSSSTKHVFAFDRNPDPLRRKDSPIILLDPDGEVRQYLESEQIAHTVFDGSTIDPGSTMFVNTFGLRHRAYTSWIDQITRFVDAGGLVIVQEPEFRVVDPTSLAVTEHLTLRVERRNDTDKGGYDSYVFPEDEAERLWRGLKTEHFQWMNGAFGGEIVSEYTVEPSLPYRTIASCGLGLRIPAVFEVRHNKGRVVVSRIQIRGRLLDGERSADPYARRYDPVAVRYLRNLISL